MTTSEPSSAERAEAWLTRMTHPSAPLGDARTRSFEPLHVLYGGAQRFQRDALAKLGGIAQKTLATFVPGPAELASIVEPASEAHLATLHARLSERLARQPIEDLRIDFEDGYGPHPDAEEDDDARRTARELRAAEREGALPRQIGIRIAPLDAEHTRRALRTLALFLFELGGAAPPAGFVVTLPKVAHASELATLHDALDELERELGWPAGSVRTEAMVELASMLRGPSLEALRAAGEDRLSSVHLGSYDLTASMGVAAPDQRADHPACTHALLAMQVAFADSHVAISDGATTRLPLARTSPPSEGDHAEVIGALAEHARNVRRALALGVHRGWDLHPAQLVARHAAVLDFHLRHEASMAARARRFFGAGARAVATGSAFDDAATGRGLARFFAQGVARGAFDAASLRAAGLDDDALAGWPAGAAIVRDELARAR